jgi:hypothetical protein
MEPFMALVAMTAKSGKHRRVGQLLPRCLRIASPLPNSFAARVFDCCLESIPAER